MTEELHFEIIRLAEREDDGALFFSEESTARLLARFRELLEEPSFPAAVDAYVRAVAAFQAGKQEKAAAQLMDIGATAIMELRAKNRSAAEKVQAAVTGAEKLASMRPVGSEPAPEGSLKGSALIRPLPKPRG